MARKKVQLAWIENHTSRKATLRKRRENLIKKVKEISVLAGTDACGIILSPFEGDVPLFYPPSINEVLGRFFDLPEIDQCKRMVTVESYLKDEISKLSETLQKERRNMKEVEVSYTMSSIHFHGRPIETLSCDETNELFWYFEELKKKCELRISSLDPNAAPESAHVPPQPVAPSMVQGSGMEIRDENVIENTSDPWLAGNFNSTMQQPNNYDYYINYPNGDGFIETNGDHHLPNSYVANNSGMAAGPNSSNNPQCPQPPGGPQQGFFSNNSGF